MDDIRFQEAIDKVVNCETISAEIGTLSEKTTHAVLKHYFEPDTNCHEILIGKNYADIFRGDEIIEIQTRALYKLNQKLSAFLPEFRVTVVYPIAHKKYLSWIDTESGEASAKRQSPKKGKIFEVLPELYGIREYLTHPNFTLCLVLMDTVEYRLLCGWGNGGKKGSRRSDRIPLELCEVLYISSKEDYKSLIPSNLSEYFNRSEFAKAVGQNARTSWFSIQTLIATGVISEKERRKNTVIYSML